MLGKVRGEGVTSKLRLGLLANGVDINGGPSATTVGAFRTTLRALKRDGELAG
jgi:hypothetical protein